MSQTVLSHTPQVTEENTLFEVNIFGREPGDWSLRRKESEGFNKIASVINQEITKLWMPIPSKANAVIASQSDFSEEVTIKRLSIMGKVFADGVTLKKGEAAAITSADCPTLVISGIDGRGKTHVIFAHAGRDCLIDRDTLLNKSMTRPYFSIISALIAKMIKNEVPFEDIYLHAYAGIQSGFLHNPQHPQYGEYNKKIIQYADKIEGALLNQKSGEIFLPAIIAYQALLVGIPKDNIILDTIDTYADKDIYSSYTWASNCRAPGYRNLVVIYHI